MMTYFDNIALVCGVIFLIAAAMMKVFPPRKINSLYGYRTALSMQSDAHWQFAQHYSTLRMIEAGLFLIVAGVIIQVISVTEEFKVAAGFIVLLAVPVYLFVRTERALKRKFTQ